MAIAVKNKLDERKAHYKTLFAARAGKMNGQTNHPLNQIRREAMEKFEDLSFPGRQDEDWKYTSVAPLLKPDYQEGKEVPVVGDMLSALEIPELDAYRLVFVNGFLQKDLSDLLKLPTGVMVEEMSNAIETPTHGQKLKNWFRNELDKATNAFTPLNIAFSNGGTFIHISKNAQVDKPLHFIYLTANGITSTFTCPQIFGIVESGANASVIESFGGVGQGDYFTNVFNRFEVDANAQLHHYKIQNEQPQGYFINNAAADQQKDSNYSSYVLDLGSKLARNNIAAHLKDSNTTTNLYGTYLPKGTEHVDNQSFVDHAHPHAYSNELYKGVMDEKGRGVFNGQVMVRQDAQKINAYQTNGNLVLSETAQIDTKPQLEIYADDVRCSHGATIGQLNEDSVFYLKARGIKESDARTMLQVAFLGEVIDNFEVEAVQNFAMSLIEKKLTK